MENKLHLSDKQKEVINLLKNDYKLYKNVTYSYMSKASFHISVSTFFALLNKGLIKGYGLKSSYCGKQYILTELGKTIEL